MSLALTTDFSLWPQTLQRKYRTCNGPDALLEIHPRYALRHRGQMSPVFAMPLQPFAVLTNLAVPSLSLLAAFGTLLTELIV